MHAYSITKSKTDGKLLTKTRLYEALVEEKGRL